MNLASLRTGSQHWADLHILSFSVSAAPGVALHSIFSVQSCVEGLEVTGPGADGAETVSRAALSLWMLYCALRAFSSAGVRRGHKLSLTDWILTARLSVSTHRPRVCLVEWGQNTKGISGLWACVHVEGVWGVFSLLKYCKNQTKPAKQHVTRVLM